MNKHIWMELTGKDLREFAAELRRVVDQCSTAADGLEATAEILRTDGMAHVIEGLDCLSKVLQKPLGKIGARPVQMPEWRREIKRQQDANRKDRDEKKKKYKKDAIASKSALKAAETPMAYHSKDPPKTRLPRKTKGRTKKAPTDHPEN